MRQELVNLLKELDAEERAELMQELSRKSVKHDTFFFTDYQHIFFHALMCAYYKYEQDVYQTIDGYVKVVGYKNFKEAADYIEEYICKKSNVLTLEQLDKLTVKLVDAYIEYILNYGHGFMPPGKRRSRELEYLPRRFNAAVENSYPSLAHSQQLHLIIGECFI